MKITETHETLIHRKSVAFLPTRTAGLKRLDEFTPRAGADYAHTRNFDYGPNQPSSVSCLSPWIKHRLISEDEVLHRTLSAHDLHASMRFVQEVFWRGYFKGWMEHHPSVWTSYQAGLANAVQQLERSRSLNADYSAAITGRTGIACFDHWCRELQDTGYLHNHARMWFASIWIFTLRLPWELGAAYFLRHLIDGDPAANTLSWRWVGGLHTKGKTYLARASNIAEFTDGQFDPKGQLAQTADPLVEDIEHARIALKPSDVVPDKPALLLVTSEDCKPGATRHITTAGVLGLCLPGPEGQNSKVDGFTYGAVRDAVQRLGANANDILQCEDWTNVIVSAAQKAGTRQVVTPYAPVGPIATKLATVRDALKAEGIELYQVKRRYDTLVWPHATKGFFKLKKKIPEILGELGPQSDGSSLRGRLPS